MNNTIKTTIQTVYELFGGEGIMENGVWVIEQPEYTFTLQEKESFLEATILFNNPCSLSLMEQVARKLASANYRYATSGFFMDKDYGHYGQCLHFSPYDAPENIGFSVFLMLSEATKYIID